MLFAGPCDRKRHIYLNRICDGMDIRQRNMKNIFIFTARLKMNNKKVILAILYEKYVTLMERTLFAIVRTANDYPFRISVWITSRRFVAPAFGAKTIPSLPPNGLLTQFALDRSSALTYPKRLPREGGFQLSEDETWNSLVPQEKILQEL